MYDDFLTSIRARVKDYEIIVKHAKLRIKAVEEQDDEEGAAVRKEAQDQTDRAETAMGALSIFYNDVEKNWASEASRVLGTWSVPLPSALGPAPQMRCTRRTTPSSSLITTRLTRLPSRAI